MKNAEQPSPNGESGITLIEMIVAIVLVGFLMLLFLPALAGNKARPARINCVNNLKQVGVAFRTWTTDGGKYPMQVSITNGGTMEVVSQAFLSFKVMSNELSTPKILLCPAEKRRQAATNFLADLSNAKISYFVGADACETNPMTLLAGDRNITNGVRIESGFLDLVTNQPAGWTHELHERQGNIGLADGSVQQFSSSKLRDWLQYTGDPRNRIAMP